MHQHVMTRVHPVIIRIMPRPGGEAQETTLEAAHALPGASRGH